MAEMLIEDYIRRYIIEDAYGEFIILDGELARAIADYIENSRKNTAPMKHGEWKWRGSFSFYQCSKCSEISERRTNYCPNCGAKMDGEKDDDKY